MKEALSNVDIAVIVEELQEILGARVDKIYQIGDEIWLKLYAQLDSLSDDFGGSGAVDLVIERGCRIHLTRYKREAPKTPSSFAMFLRKYLSGGRITSIKQMDFDRIVEICVERSGERRFLISELLPRGNVLLADDEGKIMRVIRRETFATRDLKSGVKYERPPSKWNPIAATDEDLRRFFYEDASARRDVVRVLAVEMGLGGLYAEEICARAGVSKKKRVDELSDDEINAIYDAMSEIFAPIKEHDLSKVRAHIVLKNGDAVDVLPFPLKKYENCDKEFFSTFNSAVDEYFARIADKRMREKTDELVSERVTRLERVLKEQNDALERFMLEEKELRRKAETIYERYDDVERALQEARAAGKKVVRLMFEDVELTLDTSLSPYKNASRYYERAKVLKRKRISVENAIAATREKLERERAAAAASAVVPQKQKKEKEKKKKRRSEAVSRWYERFRWTFTSHGFLVVGGRDAKSNEIIVRRYMERDDLFFHTQAEGAPVAVLKTDGREVPDDDLEEAAQFAASYSSLWKLGFYGGDCYCVSAEQVSKTPPSGEYIKKGGFIVRGRRRYFKVELSLSVGIAGDDIVHRISSADAEADAERGGDNGTILFICPTMAYRRNTQMLRYGVEIVPGDVRKEQLARRIMEILLNEAEKHRDQINISLDDLLRILPPGKGAIAQQHSMF